MPSAMVASNVLDSNEWPSLGGGGPASPSTPPRGCSTTDAKTTSILRSGVEGAAEGDGHHDDGDWENLQPLSPPPSNQRPRSVSVVTNVAVVERNRPLLRHCASSPDLRHLHNLEGIGEDEEDYDEDEEYDVINNDSESLSFAMLSGPGSVMSMASGFSFRDAILSPGVGTISEEPTDGSVGTKTIPATEPRKPRSRPRFVVKPIKRCSKSMGDLKSLAEAAAAAEDDDDDDGAMGATDAMDFYHRKALGARGRANGLKIRPDELKRKQFTLQRKEMQRQGQS